MANARVASAVAGREGTLTVASRKARRGASILPAIPAALEVAMCPRFTIRHQRALCFALHATAAGVAAGCKDF
jgi:hypothetical protein